MGEGQAPKEIRTKVPSVARTTRAIGFDRVELVEDTLAGPCTLEFRETD